MENNKEYEAPYAPLPDETEEEYIDRVSQELADYCLFMHDYNSLSGVDEQARNLWEDFTTMRF